MLEKISASLPVLALFACCMLPTPSHAEALAISSITDASMKSRTCGLILLSEGRLQLRNNEPNRGLDSLVSAFALLQDGRGLQDHDMALTASQALLTGPLNAKTAALVQCGEWLDQRKVKADFPHAEEDLRSWFQQAMVVLKTEKMAQPPR